MRAPVVVHKKKPSLNTVEPVLFTLVDYEYLPEWEYYCDAREMTGRARKYMYKISTKGSQQGSYKKEGPEVLRHKLEIDGLIGETRSGYNDISIQVGNWAHTFMCYIQDGDDGEQPALYVIDVYKMSVDTRARAEHEFRLQGFAGHDLFWNQHYDDYFHLWRGIQSKFSIPDSRMFYCTNPKELHDEARVSMELNKGARACNYYKTNFQRRFLGLNQDRAFEHVPTKVVDLNA